MWPDGTAPPSFLGYLLNQYVKYKQRKFMGADPKKLSKNEQSFISMMYDAGIRPEGGVHVVPDSALSAWDRGNGNPSGVYRHDPDQILLSERRFSFPLGRANPPYMPLRSGANEDSVYTTAHEFSHAIQNRMGMMSSRSNRETPAELGAANLADQLLGTEDGRASDRWFEIDQAGKDTLLQHYRDALQIRDYLARRQ